MITTNTDNTAWVLSVALILSASGGKDDTAVLLGTYLWPALPQPGPHHVMHSAHTAVCTRSGF